MDYAIEPFSRWFVAAQPMFRAHWEEIGSHRELIVLDPDWKQMLLLEHNGAAHGYTARAAGELCGYLWFVVVPMLHYRNDLVAVADLFYIAPAHRGPRVAQRLINLAEAHLTTAVGVSAIDFREKVSHPTMGPLLRSLGYAPCETLHMKIVKRAALRQVA